MSGTRWKGGKKEECERYRCQEKGVFVVPGREITVQKYKLCNCASKISTRKEAMILFAFLEVLAPKQMF